mmetsp:Transcript_111762/g.203129  ORF Transcript_111762/g.203129 Transcript_111762/m.203129 type:complete len:266 (+) Transcript_111762:585-1382(+)
MRFFAMLRISTAALLSFISSTNAVCSVLRCAVASATLSSRDLMPASSAAISSTRLAFFSSISSIAFWRPEAVSSKDAALSEASSRLALQSATFVSSAVCSSLRRATMSSIIFKTLPKSAFLPCKAREMRSRRWSCLRLWLFNTACACRKSSFVDTCSCNKEGLGNVFLNNSSASSSFKSLMVSASAIDSSPKTFFCSAYLAALVLQVASSSAKKAWSFSRDASVSSRSSCKFTISTPTSANREDFVSICLVSAATSFFLAAISSS